MARPKSFLKPLAIDRAARSHNCQHNASHRIRVGDVRLKRRVGRTYEHYCAACALAMIERDLIALENLRRQLVAPATDPPTSSARNAGEAGGTDAA